VELVLGAGVDAAGLGGDELGALGGSALDFASDVDSDFFSVGADSPRFSDGVDSPLDELLFDA
jgi:hypothetical protein